MRASIGKFEQLILPHGERLLWQGRPTGFAVALRVFHLRLVVAYFALLFAARLAGGVIDHQPLQDVITGASLLLIPATLALTLLGGLSVLYSRTTRYSITNRRVLLQFGAVLPMTLNVPFAHILSAGVKIYPDGSGDLPLMLVTEKRLSFLLLWPHVRPWRLNRVEPMLRCVPGARAVSDILAQALVAASPRTSSPNTTAIPVPQDVARAPSVASAA